MGRRVSSNSNNVISNSISQEIASKITSSNSQYINGKTFDVFEYVESEPNIILRVEALGDNISGYIEKDSDAGKFIIVINKNHTPLRQRFTLAHELGHYYIHKDKLEGQHTDVTLFRDANEDSLGIEYAANDFAAELLIPAEAFKDAIKKGINTPKQLSTIFQVTEKAIMYRAYKLGIIKSF